MDHTANNILRFIDLVTGKSFAVRIQPEENILPIGVLMDLYLKNPDLEILLHERRLTRESVDILRSIQDYVYTCSDQGFLGGVYEGLILLQGTSRLDYDSVPTTSKLVAEGKNFNLIEIEIERTSVGYERNWTGFHRRRWEIHPEKYLGFVQESIEHFHGPGEAERVLQLESPAQKIKLVDSVAKRIWQGDFENYSRFIGKKFIYKTGNETVDNIIDGSGGICSEKVQALKFLTDHFGINSEYLLAGPGVPDPVPEARLREMLTTFDFRFSKRHMRYWQHTSLLYNIDDKKVVVDATNGNIPYLFKQGKAADQLLGYNSKPSIQVRMAIRPEDFYYHRVSQDIPKNLYFAMEGWIEDVDLIQVFDNELGLYIAKDFLLAPVVYRNQRIYERLRREYLTATQQAGLGCYIYPDWNLDSEAGQRFVSQHENAAIKILDSRDHLLTRYDECHGPGHEAGLVIIELGIRKEVGA